MYTPLIFEGVTSEIFHNMKRALEQYGISIPKGNEGNLSGEGFSGKFIWNPEQELLTLQLISKPWFISYDTVREVVTNTITNFVHHY